MSLIKLIVLFMMLVSVSFAQRGKDGNGLINTSNKIVNEYTTLSTDASTGDITINVAASGLNTNGRFATNLTTGDLIMIIQMQGASILGQPDNTDTTISNPNNPTWGSITSYNNCGNYELCEVASVSSITSITISCGLINNYSASGKVQIVRVPRYNTLTISAPGVLTCQAWNGLTGGVLAVEVHGATTITTGGKINVTDKGFRGGALYNPASPRTQTPWYASSNATTSAKKGEGIAGYDNDYTIYGGKYCRGAAANAGGAGNVWNAGGGGGANAGNTSSWTGQGNPDVSQPGWIAAWNVELAGFATSTSSGGGRGGYSFSSSDLDATTQGPDNINWGGYGRGNIGGLGGRPLDYSTGKIFMGGGGGSGEQDNNQGGAGGNGGGIIYILGYSAINGSGSDSLLANGSAGGDSHTTPPLTSYSGKDGAGGGGGGGTVLINAPTIGGVVISTNGGNGGNQLLTAGSLYFGAMNEGEGPGGGGGGGYIATVGSTSVHTAAGGKNGTSNSDGLTEFPPNGATKGGPGLSNQSLSWQDTLTATNTTICAGDSTILIATINGVIPPGLTWYSSLTGDTIVGTDTLHTHAIVTNTTYYASVCPGIYRLPVTLTVLPSTASISISASPSGVVCTGTPITFTSTTSNQGTNPTYQWLVNNVPVGSNSSTFSSSSLSNSDTVRCVLTPTTGCAAGMSVVSDSIVIAISPTLPVSVSIVASDSTICSGSSVSFTANGINGGSLPNYQWQLNGNNTGSNTFVYTSSTLANNDVISCVFSSNATCATGSPSVSNSVTMTVHNAIPPSFTSDINSGCVLPLCVNFSISDSAAFNNVLYHFGDGDSATHFTPQHCYTQAGNYSVTVAITDTNGCQASATTTNMIIVSPQPTAGFTYAPVTGIAANTEVAFTNTSINAITYHWNFNDTLAGGSNTSLLESPTHLFANAGNYCVWLTATNIAGCTDSISKCLVVTDEPKLVIPNIFTPNGDGKNDVFSITTTSIKELQCSIYDRWGIKVAEWNKVDGTWDGRVNSGKAAQSGVYFYLINAKANNGTSFSKQGYIELLKD